MSEEKKEGKEEKEDFPTLEEQEEAARAARWPELDEEPEVDVAVLAEVESLIASQMIGEEPDA